MPVLMQFLCHLDLYIQKQKDFSATIHFSVEIDKKSNEIVTLEQLGYIDRLAGRVKIFKKHDLFLIFKAKF